MFDILFNGIPIVFFIIFIVVFTSIITRISKAAKNQKNTVNQIRNMVNNFGAQNQVRPTIQVGSVRTPVNRPVPSNYSSPTRSMGDHSQLPVFFGAQSTLQSGRSTPQANHLCDPLEHQKSESDVDMLETLNNYHYAQLDRRRFERPFTPEEKDREATELKELFNSGIIGKDEYKFKMEELRRR